MQEPLWISVPQFGHPHGEKALFLTSKKNFPLSNLSLLPLMLLVCTSKEIQLHLLCALYTVAVHSMQMPLGLLLSRLNKPSSPSLSLYAPCSCSRLDHLGVPVLDSLLCVSASAELESPNGSWYTDMVSPLLKRGIEHLSGPAGCALTTTVQQRGETFAP